MTSIHRRRNSDSAGSEDSYGSRDSGSTAPTLYSTKPSLRHLEGDISQLKKEWNASFSDQDDDTRSIAESLASTVASFEDFEDGGIIYDEPPELQHYETFDYIPTAYPSTPEEFAHLFPSSRRLFIHHDDTLDGNMNLRVDTQTKTQSGRSIDLTLFHLRMHDLKKREFSFRRYCRDSGREICHSSRKYNKSSSQRRPGFQRSVSNAFASLMSMTTDRSSITPLKRQDSGYASIDSDIEVDANESLSDSAKNLSIPTNTTLLEFSNYAHVELKRRGTKSSKRYEFDYWGQSYTWRRNVKKIGSQREISYKLYATDSSTPIAQIVPEPLSSFDQDEEARKGGWVPPSSMWISDSRTINAPTDIADVIVASGLMAFVDDCIKNKWHCKDSYQFPVVTPVTEKKLGFDYISPKRLVDEIFHRAEV